MSKKFIEGNIYVFSRKKFLEFGYEKYIKWAKQINGRKVTIIGEYQGYVDNYIVAPDWCKCIKVGDK